MKYRAVIFDLDGTLLDTLQDLADSMNTALLRYGFPAHAPEEYKYFIGNGVDNLVRAALPEESRNEAIIINCAEAMREEYGRRWAEKTRPYEGIAELLDGLHSRNIKMAVLSNKPDDFTKLIIARFLPHWKFEAVFGQRPSVPKKPDPAGAREIAGLLGIPPEKILYLGDSGTDMMMAGAAGMRAVGALWGFRTAGELKAGGAKELIQKPVDLLKLLY